MIELRKLREDVDLTQDEVCARTGIARPNLSAYENGRKTPSPETVERIRRACRLRPSVALARHSEQVVSIVHAHRGRAVKVFGSVARIEDRWDSDLDLLIEMEDGAGYFDIVRMVADLEKELGVRVDVVPSSAVLSGSSPDDVDTHILAEARPLEEVTRNHGA